MRILGVLALFMAACGEMEPTGDVTDPLATDDANAWRVPCGTPAGNFKATFRRWSGWYVACSSMPETFTAPGSFDGANWCSLAASAPYGMAACKDMACVNPASGYTSTEMGRVEVAFDCAGGPQRYYMVVSPR